VATEVGEVTIHTRDGELAIRDGVEAGGPVARWPGVALAQLVTGGQPAEVVCALHDTALPHQALDLLSALFPRRWRFTRNEDWTYAQ
jgi:hypothetical protein